MGCFLNAVLFLVTVVLDRKLKHVYGSPGRRDLDQYESFTPKSIFRHLHIYVA